MIYFEFREYRLAMPTFSVTSVGRSLFLTKRESVKVVKTKNTNVNTQWRV